MHGIVQHTEVSSVSNEQLGWDFFLGYVVAVDQKVGRDLPRL
jgi:hypothetical protein